jgi:hypothetical protein
MAYEGGNKNWATLPVLTCHADVHDFAMLEGSGGARARERSRIPSSRKDANLVSMPRAFVSLTPRDGGSAPGGNCRLPVPGRHSWTIGQPYRLGRL